MRQFASAIQTLTRLAAVLAVAFSAVFARPLHELEHSGSATQSRVGRIATCSCGHLHGQRPRAESLPARRPVDNPAVPSSEQQDGGHNHQSCGICLAFGLQTPAEFLPAASLECLQLSATCQASQPQCSKAVPVVPPLRGPPVA